MLRRGLFTSALIAIVVLGVSAPASAARKQAAAGAEARLSWAMLPRFGGPNTEEYARPRSWAVALNGCSSRSDKRIVEYLWEGVTPPRTPAHPHLGKPSEGRDPVDD